MTKEITKSIGQQIIEASEGACAFQAVSSVPSLFNTFKATADTRSSVKGNYTQKDYRYYRNSETLPCSDKEYMKFGTNAYYDVPIVRNVVDLMSDFVCKGIRWQQTNRNVEAFYSSWFKHCEGFEVSERFVNYLLVMGNNVIYPVMSKIRQNLATEWKKTRGSEFARVNYKNGYIPSSYNFISPIAVNQITTELTNFIGARVFQINIGNGLSSNNFNVNFQRVGQDVYSTLYSKIPNVLQEKIKEGNGTLIFTDDELVVNHYRKNDWEIWAKPMISCIFPQLIMLDKMHLADMSALDGAISNIRLWRVGYIDTNNINNSFIPTPTMLAKIREIIQTNLTGGVLDLVWGPELDFKESSSQVHNYLKPEKYTQLMSEIYDGLAVPPSLSGGGSGTGGFTNNFIAMKVLVDRLNYLRVKLSRFWENEAKKVQKAMGFSSPAKLKFDDAIMSDEQQYKQLLIDLWDREILDDESIRDEFNVHNDVISSRLLKERKRRDNFKSPPKASPFHDPMLIDKMKIDLTKEGMVDDNKLPFTISQPPSTDTKYKPKNDVGRPNGVKDDNKRKQKVVRPRTSAFINIQNWARDAYDDIGKIVNSFYLSKKNKTSVRELTASQISELEDLKLHILCNHKPFTKITSNSISEVTDNLIPDYICISVRDTLVSEAESKFKREMTIDDKRKSSAAAYALVKIDQHMSD